MGSCLQMQTFVSICIIDGWKLTSYKTMLKMSTTYNPINTLNLIHGKTLFKICGPHSSFHAFNDRWMPPLLYSLHACGYKCDNP